MKDKKQTSQSGETTSTDWSEVRRRLETARAVTERGATRSAEEKRAILKARAKALAEDPDGEKQSGEKLEIIEFLLADERYGIETAYVREAYPLKEITPLPGTPPFVLGLVNVRGQILSVIDIKKLFDLPEKPLTDLSKVIILRYQTMEFGVLADAVLGVRSLPVDRIQPPPATLKGQRTEYLRGVTNEPMSVLDAQKILSDERLIVHEEVGT